MTKEWLKEKEMENNLYYKYIIPNIVTMNKIVLNTEQIEPEEIKLLWCNG